MSYASKMEWRAIALLVLAACGSTTTSHAPLPLHSGRPCLAPGNPMPIWPQRRNTGSVIGSLTVDRGEPSGIGVELSRDSQELSGQTSDELGGYGFYDLEPGTYDLTFRYGERVVAHEQVNVEVGASRPLKTHLELAKLPQIPRCV